MEYMWLAVVTVFGLCFGSFVTMASYRLPREQGIVRKPSCCTSCGQKLGVLDLFPVFSWLFARGRCRHCGAGVSVRYPLTELVTACAFLLVYSRYGISLHAGVLMLLAVALLVMIVADLEHYIIPDMVHLVLLPLGFIYHYLKVSDASEVLGGLAAGLVLGLALHYGYYYLRKRHGLGFGDVKFLAVAGFWLGLTPLVPFLFYAGMFGVATGLLWRLIRRGTVFPFGPALALSLFMCVVYPEIPAQFWGMYDFMK
jgi:prepilin signal peptidase PulO-like enzyme (type II secretory pathway)